MLDNISGLLILVFMCKFVSVFMGLYNMVYVIWNVYKIGHLKKRHTLDSGSSKNWDKKGSIVSILDPIEAIDPLIY